MALPVIDETIADVVTILKQKIEEWGAYTQEKTHTRLMSSDASTYETVLAESKEAVDIIHTTRGNVNEICRILKSPRYENDNHEVATIVKQCIDITDNNITSGLTDSTYNSSTFQLIGQDWSNLLVYLLHRTNI